MFHHLFRSIFLFFRRMGGFGLLGLGVLDSSFLFLPFGNDLLLVALTARKPGLFWYYALMATAGSITGCLITDFVARKLSEARLERLVPKDKLERAQKKLENHTVWVMFLSALLPPPFPFTVFLMAAAALQLPRIKLLPSVGAGRLVRFFILGFLAMHFGRHILRLMRRPEVEYVVGALAVISIVGSVFSLWRWLGGRRGQPTPKEASTAHGY